MQFSDILKKSQEGCHKNYNGRFVTTYDVMAELTTKRYIIDLLIRLYVSTL